MNIILDVCDNYLPSQLQAKYKLKSHAYICCKCYSIPTLKCNQYLQNMQHYLLK